MRHAALALLLLTAATARAADRRELGPRTWVQPLADGVWLLVTTHATKEWGDVEANGLAVASGPSALLIDPGWDDEQAGRLVRWARVDLHADRVEALVTHAHGDRIGGIRALLDQGVEVVESARTAALAEKQGYPPPTRTFADETHLRAGTLDVEVLFPGGGHTADNVVAYVPARQVLFGGCLLKAMAWKNLGYVDDADIAAWPRSLVVVKTRFPQARIVVPGHDAVGGMEIVDHTLALAKAAPAPK